MKDNHVNHGLYVKGDDVIAYGLAVEHTLEDLTIWDGERGQVYFYQSELPYGVDQASFGDKYVVFENGQWNVAENINRISAS